MKFVPMKEILELAQEKKVAYGGYVFWSYEVAKAASEAASALNVPLILMCGQGEIDMMGGFEGTVAAAKAACRDASVPVALHLDHSLSFEACSEAINAGFSSVMIDKSALPFEENIKETRKVVERAHAAGVTVEGELGRLVGEEGAVAVKGPEAAQTDPEEAREFVERTGIDVLAISIGTQHGQYRFEPKLNIERLKRIEKSVTVPLVLHGGSGTPMEQVQEAIRNGIRKINICTDIVIAMGQQYIRTQSEEGFRYSTANLFLPVYQAVKDEIAGKMKAFLLQ
ncbi:class II fructose-bisphosphate aldolase [Lacrimispora sp. NSJ-141]|uniref:Class II fructose-bisphosphate aldolase n=1 Tax=Lientehia hominis TaxID=2897778 RepID=A0AAP2RKB3_9FIRM|nr:class II fructose-bisphosphate aldolase [Lientehia hominis]MCD2492323.1 class II fructose-bisphosphate aldolase [Lientehia hominis]